MMPASRSIRESCIWPPASGAQRYRVPTPGALYDKTAWAFAIEKKLDIV
jgi:hypothetical protein